ncbi:hypothetical protein HAX54_014385, partial [Datura stramonium]|nr:hypothetical protein [Datura stramonium]
DTYLHAVEISDTNGRSSRTLIAIKEEAKKKVKELKTSFEMPSRKGVEEVESKVSTAKEEYPGCVNVFWRLQMPRDE